MVFAVFVAVQIGFCDWPFIEATFLVVVVVVDVVVVVVVAVVVVCCCCDPIFVTGPIIFRCGQKMLILGSLRLLILLLLF